MCGWTCPLACLRTAGGGPQNSSETCKMKEHPPQPQTAQRGYLVWGGVTCRGSASSVFFLQTLRGVLICCRCDKRHTTSKSNLGGRKNSCGPHHSPSLREIKAGTLNRNRGRNHGGTLLVGLFFLLACSACFFMQPRTTSLGATPHSGLSLSQSLIKKTPPQTRPRAGRMS